MNKGKECLLASTCWSSEKIQSKPIYYSWEFCWRDAPLIHLIRRWPKPISPKKHGLDIKFSEQVNYHLKMAYRRGFWWSILVKQSKFSNWHIWASYVASAGVQSQSSHKMPDAHLGQMSYARHYVFSKPFHSERYRVTRHCPDHNTGLG